MRRLRRSGSESSFPPAASFRPRRRAKNQTDSPRPGSDVPPVFLSSPAARFSRKNFRAHPSSREGGEKWRSVKLRSHHVASRNIYLLLALVPPSSPADSRRPLINGAPIFAQFLASAFRSTAKIGFRSIVAGGETLRVGDTRRSAAATCLVHAAAVGLMSALTT